MPTTNVGTLSEPQFNILNALAKADSPSRSGHCRRPPA